MLTTHIVTSADGIRFSVQFESRTETQAAFAKVAEERFARTKTATELISLGDYQQISNVIPFPVKRAAYV